MSHELHRRATEVLRGAVALDPRLRDEYLDEACGQDAELRAEVDGILAHDRATTIVGDIGLRPASTADRHRSGPLGSMRQALGTRRAWFLITAALLLTVGFWTHGRIETTLLGIRAHELESVLDSDVRALNVWLEEQTRHLRVLAENPRVVAAAADLVRIGDEAGTVDELLATPARAELAEILGPIAASESNHGLGIVDEHGRLVFSTAIQDTGLVATQLFRPYLTRALDGHEVFCRPHRWRELFRGADTGTMYTIVLVPIRQENGQVIGVLGVAHAAYERFSGLLEVSRIGATGETYALDASGLMLSNARFTEELRELGLAPLENPDEPWNTRSQLNVQVRELAPRDVGSAAAARPLTVIASHAIAARGRPDGTSHRGVVLTPYPNYRGTEVIGAWRWLPEYDFGVVTEIEAAEALAPLWYLNVTFGVLLGLLCVSSAATVVSAFSSHSLRRQMRELGQYRLRSPIGQGGMGTVYLAEHAFMKRPTAVKVLSNGFSDESIAAFQQEVRLAGELNHPNTVAIYDFGRTSDGVFFYAMEYVEGPTLAELVARQGALPPARVVHLLKQVCGSLAEAHGKNLVHLDIKPQNIMVCERGGIEDVIKVLDFGLAARTESSSSGVRTGAAVAGTPIYMSPERLLEPERVDVRMDVYSLGAVAYYLLAGRPIFDPTGDLDLLYRIARELPEPVSSVAPREIDPRLAALVMQCLQKEPENRPASVADIASGLRATELE